VRDEHCWACVDAGIEPDTADFIVDMEGTLIPLCEPHVDAACRIVAARRREMEEFRSWITLRRHCCASSLH